MDETQYNGHEDSSAEERIRRPRLERTAPNRSMLPNLGLGRGAGWTPVTEGILSDITRASIETAYRVVDAQLEYGRRVASQIGFAAPQQGPDGSNGVNAAAYSFGPGTPLDALFKTYAGTFAELTSVWFRIMLEVAAQTQTPLDKQPPASSATAPSAEAAPQPPQPAAARDEAVPEPRRIFVPVDLRPGEAARVETPPLGDVDPQTLRASAARSRERAGDYLLVQVSPGSSSDTATFVISVPAGQALGLYDSVISEPGASLLGVLTINVAAP